MRSTPARCNLLAASLLALAALGQPTGASAQGLEVLVEPTPKPERELILGAFGPADVKKSETQRAKVVELARRRLGVRVGQDTATDLDAMQRLVDGGHVRRDDVYLQQSLGVVLGDALDRDLRTLGWAAIDDRYGHSRTLRYRDSDQLFFPVTMISKRVKAGERVDMRALYDQVKQATEELERQREEHLRKTRGRR